MSSAFSKLKNKNPFKKITELPKTAQDTIPFIEAYDNGLFLVAENKYTIIFAFENIDYMLIRDSEQEDTYKKYMKLMNSLPTDIEYQEFLMNAEIDIETLRKAVIPENDGRFNKEIYQDYCSIMESYAETAKDGSAKKIMLIAMSYQPQNNIDDVSVLFRYYREIQTYFQAMKSNTRQLQPMDVFAILHKFYHQFDNTDFLLPKNFLRRGGRIKDYIAPSMFAFRAKSIEIGTSFARILFVKTFDRSLDDAFISDLLDNKEKITVSKHIRRIDKGEASDMVNKRIKELQGKVQKRMEENFKHGLNYIPFSYTDLLQVLEDLQKQLADTDCELFHVGVFISVAAKSKEELETITEYVESKARKHQVQIDVLTWQQEKGLTTILPFANNQFAKKNSSICTYILSGETSVMIPFSTINHFSDNGTCYGLSINSTSQSVIILDRTNEMNSNGFVLGTSGSGKSVFTKMEILDIILKHPNDEFIVIDPENEYWKICRELGGEMLKISPNSPTHFNVFDTDLSYSEDGTDAIALKSQFVMSIVETAKGMALTSNEKTIIDRCVRQLFKEFVSAGGNSEYLPTLTDFYNILLQQKEQEAADIAVTMELYTKGSFDVFAHKTNVQISKPFLVIDIFDMGEQLRAVGLQIILEYLWQRVIENKKKGKRTWIWIDEFSYFFADGDGRETIRSGAFFAKAYKRIRKHGGTVTGITQNITEVLESRQAQKMLGNAEFVVLLQQKKDDWNAVAKLFDLSESQSAFLRTGEKGSGLLICGQKIIPFRKPIPKDTLVYDLVQTSSLDAEKKVKKDDNIG